MEQERVHGTHSESSTDKGRIDAPIPGGEGHKPSPSYPVVSWDRSNPDFGRLLNGLDVPEWLEQPFRGAYAWYNSKGWRVLALHYTADPDKCPETEKGQQWIAAAKGAMPNERDWKREYELDFTVSAGEPFYTQFSRTTHVARCTFDPDLPLLRGWDFGRGHPACVWAQLGRDQILRILYSLIGTNLNIYRFAPLVITETNARFPGVATVSDFGDPSGAQETDKGATTAVLMIEFGINIHYRHSWKEEGEKMIEQRLLVREDGNPGLLLDPINKSLIDGFAGGFELDSQHIARTDTTKLLSRSKKDGFYDHLMDALRYLVVNMFTFESSKGQNAEKAVSLWRTNAQNRKIKEKSGDIWGEFLGSGDGSLY